MEKDNKEEKEIEQNNEFQRDVLEEKKYNGEKEENNQEEIIKMENDVQENIEAEVETEEINVKVNNENLKELESIIETEQEENIDEDKKIENIIQIESEENNKTKTKFWLLLIPLILIILIVIYLFTDLFKTDEQNFEKYMYITSKNIENLRSKELEKYFDKTKYTSNGEISLTAEGEKTKVQFNGSTDVEKRLKETNIITDYGEKELEINYKQDNDIYAIKIDELHDKYIAIENNNLKELAKLLDLESNKIPNRVNLEECKFTEEELEDIKERYTKIIKNEIIKENYSKEKNEEHTIYKLSLTKEQLNSIKIKVLQELKNDSLILDKYVIYEEMNGNIIGKEDWQKAIEENIRELEEEKSEQEKEALVISIDTKLNKCEKIEIKLTEEIIVIEMYSNSFKITSKVEEVDTIFEIQKEKNEQELKYNIQMEGQNYDIDINLKYSELSKNSVKEEYDIDLKLDNEKINLNYTNTTSQDENLLINPLQNSECEILNNLNKNEINELIYEIYNNLISL